MPDTTRTRNGRDATVATGIEMRHEQRCPACVGGACSCAPSYRASIRIGGAKQRSPWVGSRDEAEAWRLASAAEKKRGKQTPSWEQAPAEVLPTVDAAATAYEDAMRSGAASPKGRSRHYAPGTIARASGILRTWIVPRLADRPAANITRQDALRVLADVRSSVGASSTRNAKSVAGGLWAWMIDRGDYGVTENPWRGQRVAADDETIEVRRGVTWSEAERLIDAAPEGDRDYWATAFMSGLRRGELVAIRWQDVVGQTIRVERQFDFAARPGRFRATKTARGVRTVPIPRQLADRLAARRRLLAGTTTDLIFPPPIDGRRLVVDPQVIQERARVAWGAAGLEAVLLHECRHTYASLAASWGVKILALSRYMGHSSIQTTVDRYGTLYPEDVETASALLTDGIARSAGPPSGPPGAESLI